MAAAVIGQRRDTRSDRIQDAITYALSRKRAILNSDEVRSVTVTVKFKNGTGEPRVVLVNVELEDELGE